METLLEAVVEAADFMAEVEAPILAIKLLFMWLMSLIHIGTLLLRSGKTLVLLDRRKYVLNECDFANGRHGGHDHNP